MTVVVAGVFQGPARNGRSLPPARRRL